MAGIGTLTAPWDLTAALLNPSTAIHAGDTLSLFAGDYAGDWVNTFLAGTEGAEITFAPYNNGAAKINGSFRVNGSYLIFRDLEICYTGWTKRDTLEAGSDPSDIPDSKTLQVYAPYCKFINCIIHDLAGPSFATSALGAEFYGCIIYHNGWSGPDRGHGHGLYVQNDTPIKYVKDCIIFDNFGWGIHAYTENGTINNIHLEGNTCFKNGSLQGAAYNDILLGGFTVAQNPTLIANMTYGIANNLGYNAGVSGAVLQNNYFPGGLTKVNAEITEETGNYYGPAAGNQVFVRPNAYQTDRANVTIYNEVQSDSVTVDLSAVTGLAAGDSIEVHNVQDYFVDIQTLTLDAGKQIAVDMQAANRTVAAPVAWTAPPTTFPVFGAFVIEKA